MTRPASSTRIVLSLLAATALAAGTQLLAQGAVQPKPTMQTTTLDEQVDLALTVYNSDIALIRDTRALALPSGIFDLHFGDIAATVRPETVHFRSLTRPAAVRVLEQNYEYDLLDPAKLLDKYVGRDVTLVRRRTEAGSTIEEAVTARLLANNNGPVWRIGDEIVTGMSVDHMRFPEVPGNLFARPTLVWKLEGAALGDHRVEASYLAGGLSWKADYVLTVARDDKTADLDGWVTLTNHSGTSFRDARLQLVAGDVNRVHDMPMPAPAMEMMVRAAGAADMAQEAFGEYHLYTLGRKTTVANRETKQLALLNGSGITVGKQYVVSGRQASFRNQRGPGAPVKEPVQVFFRFRNDEASGLGLPMPAGIIRVYQADSRGSLQFAGEDRIDHTPKDETIDIKIGTAFDVVAERRQVAFQRVADRVVEVEHEIVVRNHKDAAIEVQVDEPIGGSWEMLRSSHKWEQTSAWSARFVVAVGAGGTSTLRYRVRVTS